LPLREKKEENELIITLKDGSKKEYAEHQIYRIRRSELFYRSIMKMLVISPKEHARIKLLCPVHAPEQHLPEK